MATPAQASEFIAEMLEGLKEMADRSRLNFLGYLVSVAAEEAREESRRNRAKCSGH
jgi:hypothetical protein